MRKIVAGVCFFMLFMAMAIQPLAANSVSLSEVTLKDLNSDGEMSNADLRILRQALFNDADENDMNGDGIVDVRDLVKLKKVVVKFGSDEAETMDGLTSDDGAENTKQWDEMQ